MKSSREARKSARSLFRGCTAGGTLDRAQVRAVADALVTEKPRGYLEVLKLFTRLVRLELGRRHAVVESAMPLEESELSVLRDQIAATHGSDLTFESVVRPELIGGLRVRVGSDVWDGTVRARIDALPA